MNVLKRFILNRKKDGNVYLEKKKAKLFYRKHNGDKYSQYFKKYYQYCALVYWFSGDFIRKIGIERKILQNLRELDLGTYNVSTVILNDISLNYNKPTLLKLIYQEYEDIFPDGMYYDKTGMWLNEPDFSETVFSGEGPYETASVQLKKGDVVIDCGANMGIFSILAVKRGASTVYAFDPQDNALRLLNDNIKLNNSNAEIIPVPYGLSNRKCTLSFTEDNENIGASRISREGDIGTTTIECTTLDDWVEENNIPRVDFIKADIEGAERDMLNGARQVIKRDHPRIAICTYHLPDDPAVLRDIILSIDSTYRIEQREMKLYAW